jgi:DNA polymerase III sliding clamp (beta) subunit (PCNA family)
VKFTKYHQIVSKFTSLVETRPEIARVRFDGHTAVASDSFRLVEVKNIKKGIDPKQKPILISRRAFMEMTIKKEATIEDLGDEKVKISEDSRTLVAMAKKESKAFRFPEYEKIFDEVGPTIDIKLNPEYLEEILGALKKINKTKVTLRISKKDPLKPITLLSEGNDHQARALLMPMTS